MSIENDIDNLSKWLNEDIVSDIDRKALARVLGHLRYPPKTQPTLSSSVWQDLRNKIQAAIDRPEGRWGIHGHHCIDDDYFIALEWVVERMDEILKNSQLTTVYGEPK
jgi:hypothetical protein